MIARMGAAVLGSEAVASGVITRGQLRWNYRAIYPDVYIPRDITSTMPTKAHAAWLWSERRGVITGRAAAALHGALWVDADDAGRTRMGQQPHACRHHQPPRSHRRRRDVRARRHHRRQRRHAQRSTSGASCPATRRSPISTRSPARPASRPRTCCSIGRALCGHEGRPALQDGARSDGRRSAVAEGDVAAAAAHRRRLSAATDADPALRVRRPQSLISTWVGRTFACPSNTTATNTAPTERTYVNDMRRG